MPLMQYYRISKGLPPKVIIEKGLRFAGRTVRYRLNRIRDRIISSYATKLPFSEETKLLRYMPFVDPGIFSGESQKILDISSMYVNHMFDLLGSGWVSVYHGKKCRGLEGIVYPQGPEVNADSKGDWLKVRVNSANFKRSRSVWSLIENSDYRPIDWQLDFKSGYRWSGTSGYKDISYGHIPGVDVKVPWELARMQHLPMLAWAYVLSGEAEGFQPSDVYVREYRNQVLDYIASNPPRFGVNWCCTMDVGIRVANILVAYDLFRANGADFDTEFEKVLIRSVYEHGLHCIENLEYSPQLRSNHYLSDIAGLLFSAAYLPCSEETDRWLAFAVQELLSEMDHQFNPDGSNFEASTSYHRLSAEIMLYCAVLVVSLPEEKRLALSKYDPDGHRAVPRLKPAAAQSFDPGTGSVYPGWFWEMLEKAIEFTRHVTKPSGEIVQVGDNDSGRFIKLWPSYLQLSLEEAVNKYSNLEGYDELPDGVTYWDENILDHRHLIAAGGAMFQREDFFEFEKYSPVEAYLIRTMLSQSGDQIPVLGEKSNKALLVTVEKPENVKFVFRGEEDICVLFESMDDLTKNLQSFAYPDFGLYGWFSPELFLSVRCGSIGQLGNGGHAHNDQLSVELQYKNRDIICDPGNYLYTPYPELRNLYRSTFSHAVPLNSGNKEQNSWPSGYLFKMNQLTTGVCVCFDKNFGFFEGLRTDRFSLLVKIERTRILCTPLRHPYNKVSNGYGKKQHAIKPYY